MKPRQTKQGSWGTRCNKAATSSTGDLQRVRLKVLKQAHGEERVLFWASLASTMLGFAWAAYLTMVAPESAHLALKVLSATLVALLLRQTTQARRRSAELDASIQAEERLLREQAEHKQQIDAALAVANAISDADQRSEAQSRIAKHLAGIDVAAPRKRR
jgi:hypothetical protein